MKIISKIQSTCKKYKNLIVLIAALVAISSYILPFDQLFAAAKTTHNDKTATDSTNPGKDSKTTTNHGTHTTTTTDKQTTSHNTKTKPPPPPPPHCKPDKTNHKYGCEVDSASITA